MELSAAIGYWPILGQFVHSTKLAKCSIDSEIVAFLVLDEDDGNDLLVLTANNRIYGYGKRNRFGWLGCGHSRPQESTEIVELSGRVIVEMLSGECHVLALDNEGVAWAWGHNADGQLGNGTTNECLRPSLVVFCDDSGQKDTPPFIVSIKCSYNYNMALDNQGRVYSWGKNQYGQLGLGSSVTKQLKPMMIAELIQYRMVSIACGYWHSLALTDQGQVFAWGRNKYGQVGIGNYDLQTSPVPILPIVDGDTGQDNIRFKAIACGGWHSLLLSDDGHQIYAFGYNDFGQLGYPTAKIKCCIPIRANFEPRIENGDERRAPSTVRSIAAQHNMSIGLLDDHNGPHCIVWGVLKKVDRSIIPRLPPLATTLNSIDHAFGRYSVAKYTPYLIRVQHNNNNNNNDQTIATNQC